MNKLFEAQNMYKENRDRTALFESAYTSNIRITEALEFLKDTIGDTFDKEEYGKFLDKKYAEKIKGKSSTDRLVKNFWGR